MTNRGHRIVEVSLFALVIAALGAACVMAAAVAMNRAFQVDEVEHIHVAYNMSQGLVPFVDFWEGHNLLLHAMLWPLVDASDPSGTFAVARVLSFAMMLGTAGAVAYCAHRLAGETAALVAPGLLLLNSTFVERGMEVRPDIGIVLCAMIALAVGLSSMSRMRRHVLQGLALGFAFAFSTKAAFVCFAFGLSWLVAAVAERRPMLVVAPMLAWVAPPAAMVGALASVGAADAWFELGIAANLGHVSGSRYAFEPWRYLLIEMPRNRFFVAAAVAGVGFALAAWRPEAPWRRAPAVLAVAALLLALGRDPFPVAFLHVAGAVAVGYALRNRPGPENRAGHAFVGWLCIVVVAGLFLNPFPYTYFQVTALPPLALAAGLVLGCGVRWHRLGDRRAFRLAFALACLGLAAWTSAERIVKRGKDTNSYQLAMVDEISAITDADDAVWDMTGLYFRPDGHPVFVMTNVMLKRYRRDKKEWPRFRDMLREREVVVYGRSYRTRWLSKSEQKFIFDRFVHYAGSIYVLGRKVGLRPGKTLEFEVLKTKEFDWRGTGTLLVDGEPFTRGVLEKGVRVLSTPDGARGILILASARAAPPEELERPQKPYAASRFRR